jgi:hypothetical protein
MFKRILLLFVVVSAVLVVPGCGEEEIGVPVIVGTARHVNVEPIQPLPTSYVPKPANLTSYGNVPSLWFPPKAREKRWKAIVIHHSGTRSGNAAIFDDWHRNTNHWQGVGYDFVIGNGNESTDGRIEVTFRWRQQIPGAHVGGTPNNWANVDAIGICLVGDFNKTVPTRRQTASLLKLIRFLQKRYNIPTSSIYGHKDTPGYTGKTQCPGRNFSVFALKRML